MRFRLKWTSIASAALVAGACSTPQPSALLKPGSSGGDAGAGGQADEAGASSCENAGAAGVAGADPSCIATSGGVAGGGLGSSGAASGGVGGSVLGGAATTAGAGGGGGAAVAGSNNGGTSGSIAGGGNATGGVLSKCELLLVMANAQLQGAQTCSTATGEAFCTGYTTNECGCKVPVNNAESVSTENYVKARDTFKNTCPVSCTTPCVEPKSQSCQLIFGLVVGSCVAM